MRTNPVPLYTMLLLTLRCHQRCEFCSVGSPRNEDMDYGLAEQIIDELAVEGGRYVGFSGGEPFLHPMLFEVVMHAHQRRLNTSVTTTGVLIEKSDAGWINAFVNSMGISLHGRPEVHERMTRSDGYRRVLLTLEILRRFAPSTNVTLLYTLSSSNASREDLDHVLYVAKCFNVRLSIARATYVGRCDASQMLLPAQLQEAAEWILLNKPRSEVSFVDCVPPCVLPKQLRTAVRGCSAGFEFGSLDPTGEVKICPQSSVSFGRVCAGKSLKDVWQGNQAQYFRGFDWQSSSCLNCAEFEQCKGGCHVEGKGIAYSSDHYSASHSHSIGECS